MTNIYHMPVWSVKHCAGHRTQESGPGWTSRWPFQSCSDSAVILGCAGCTPGSLREAAKALRGLSEQLQEWGKEQDRTPLTRSMCCPSGRALWAPSPAPHSYQRRV